MQLKLHHPHNVRAGRHRRTHVVEANTTINTKLSYLHALNEEQHDRL